jgi:hypothetical protein
MAIFAATTGEGGIEREPALSNRRRNAADQPFVETLLWSLPNDQDRKGCILSRSSKRSPTTSAGKGRRSLKGWRKTSLQSKRGNLRLARAEGNEG